MERTDTIFAVAAGGAGSAVTVVRISGSRAGTVLDRMAGPRPAPRHAALRTVRDGTGETIDRGLVLWFPGPGSYTGEDVVELQLHGGAAVLDAASDALVRLGLRPAEPGEFTRRAFIAGRMDLTEAEAVADLIAAETQAQRAQALRQMDGALETLYSGWAARLTRLLAHHEATIDFLDEDLPPETDAAARAEVEELRAGIVAHLGDAARGERVRTGLVVAVTGAPNVGKSSLVNALAGRDVAIVSPFPGTTRDAVEVRVVMAGVPVTLVDTAGLRATDDPVEAEGVRRARARAEAADLVLVVREAGGPAAVGPAACGQDAPVLHVASKIDLGGVPKPGEAGVSVVTGEGIETLRQVLDAQVLALTRSSSAAPPTRARHAAALREAAERLDAAGDAPLPELRAEDLRLAVRALGRLTGRVGVEDVLDAIFAEFCIGK